MQQPSDMACNMACAAMRDMSRTAGFMLDAQIELSRFRLKLAEAALEDVHEMEHELGGAHDWSSLASVQSMFMRLQSTHSATALKTWVDFINKLQAAYLRQLTEWSEQMQRPEGQTSSSQLFASSADSLRAFFDSFNVMALSDTEAKRRAPARSAAVKTEHAG